MKRSALVPALLTAAVFTMSGCATSTAPAATTLTASPVAGDARPPSPTLAISVTKDMASASPTSVHVGLNQPVTLRITAVRAGELHVHSTPEQQVSFPEGTSQITLTFTVPGTVEVEDHALDQKLLQIQVR